MYEILIQDMEENQSEKNQKYRWASSHEMDCVTRYFRLFYIYGIVDRYRPQEQKQFF